MKALNFSKKSWHYWLANLGNYNEDREDFCHYVRSAIVGVFVCAMIAVVALAVIVGVGDFIAWIVAMIVAGTYIEPRLPAQVTASLLFISAVIGILLGISLWNEKRKIRKLNEQIAREREILNAILEGKEPLPAPQPNFIQSAYKTLKEKTCFKVNLE